LLVVMLALGALQARAGETLLESRPCGPDGLTGPLRLLVPQGVGGADFRPACRAHDACYDTPGADRSACDERFLRDMLGACGNSRRPLLCRLSARTMHRLTAKHGEDSFRSAQAIAWRKLAAE
jgi:hypothetical protein